MLDLKNTDSRLEEVYKLIDSGMISLLSLDVFDTMLWRKVPDASDIFIILGRKLKEDGWLIDAIPAEAFPDLRHAAHKVANIRKKELTSSEVVNVTLQEIYWSLHGIFPQITIEDMITGKVGIINESDIDELVAKEVEIEKQLTQLDINILKLILYANAKNIPCILVSDTYFNLEQLTYLLDRIIPKLPKPFLKYIKAIYPSCCYGMNKRNGLLKIAIDEQQVPPENILHIGDNYENDFQIANELGLKAIHYQKYNAELSTVIDKEWPTDDIQKRSLMLDSLQGDYGLTTLRTSVSAHKSILKDNNDNIYFRHYGATVFGPILAGFTKWIYKRCKEMNATQVFCLMREGQLYSKLINKMAPLHPDFKIDSKDLWISRLYITHASIAYATPEELATAAFRIARSSHTVESFCQSIEVDYSTIPELIPLRHVRLFDEKLRKHIAELLSQHQLTRELIIKSARNKRKRFLKYLSTLTDLKTLTKMVLVDVGWGGTLQAAIQAILHMEGYDISVHGLYLGTERGTDASQLRGHIREGFLQKVAFPKGSVKLVRKGFFALEQTATAELLPLKDFDEEGNVLLGKSVISEKQQQQARLVQEGIDLFIAQFIEYQSLEMITLDPTSMYLENQLREILIRSASLLTQSEAKYFGAWCHDFATGRDTMHDTLPVGDIAYYDHFIADMVPDAAFDDHEIIWPAAYLAKYDENWALAAKTVYTEALPARCFQSHDTLPIKITLSKSQKESYKIQMRSNANRRFFALETYYSLDQAIKEIRFEITCPKHLIRINSLRMFVRTKLNADRSEYIFFEAGNEEKVKCQATKFIEDNTYYCAENLSMTYPFEVEGIYSVQVNLCCEIFKLEG